MKQIAVLKHQVVKSQFRIDRMAKYKKERSHIITIEDGEFNALADEYLQRFLLCYFSQGS